MFERTTPSGLRVTEVGFGGAQMGNLYRAVDDATASASFQAAWEGGVRYFDTAPHYGLGLSERRLGACLAGKPRDEYVLSTKVGRLLVPRPHGDGARDDQGFDVPATHRRVWDFSRDGVLRSLESSLDRLGLDRIDLVYVHDPEDHWQQACRGAFPALAELRAQGVIGGYGAGMNQSRMLTDLVRDFEPDAVMVAGRYTLLEQPAAADLLPAAMERGVGVVVAGVFNSGMLAAPRPAADATYDYAPAPPELIDRAHRLADVCETHGVTLPEAAVAFPLRHPAVTAVVLGSATAGQVEQNLRHYRAEVPDALWSDLAAHGLLPAQSA
jgi:aryl-alcohol dehydrogenase-like predicted oxidoreductase